jgi:hypothetical protein
MPVSLPLIPSVPRYRFGTTLDNTQYVFEVYWNGRDAAWYMNVLQTDETPVQYGIKIVLGAALGGLVIDPAFPPGIMVALDLSGADLDATFDDLGTRVIVQYFTLDEVRAG